MKGLLSRMGVGAEAGVSQNEGALFVEITGDEEGIMIGRGGRTMDALQTLVRRMVNRQREEPVRVEIDVDGYRRRREESLTRLARRSSEEARTMGRVVTLGPLSASERRMIHVLFQKDPFVSTESVGEGDLKKIRIIPNRKGG
jgi:spoIIIJ-associated protein